GGHAALRRMARASPPRSRPELPRGREAAARCGECRSRIGAPFGRQSPRGTRNHQKPFTRKECFKPMTETIVRSQDVCKFKNGVLESIDLSKLYFPDDEEPRQEIRLVRVAPKPTSLLAPPKITRRALVPMAELTLTRTSLLASR